MAEADIKHNYLKEIRKPGLFEKWEDKAKQKNLETQISSWTFDYVWTLVRNTVGDSDYAHVAFRPPRDLTQ